MTIIHGLKSSMGKVIETLYSRAGQFLPEHFELASAILNKGGIIAVPTDTVYGVAAKLDDEVALERLYSIKGRDKIKPLALCLASVEEVSSVADISDIKQDLLNALLPGPVTLLLKRSPNLPSFLNPSVSSIGIRIPDHNFIRAIAQEVGPLALTSANKSGHPSALVVDDFKDLIPELDATFDCGPTAKMLVDSALEGGQKLENSSTVIDLTPGKRYNIIREGKGLNRAINVLARYGYRRRSVSK